MNPPRPKQTKPCTAATSDAPPIITIEQRVIVGHVYESEEFGQSAHEAALAIIARNMDAVPAGQPQAYRYAYAGQAIRVQVGEEEAP